ncbi:hypothetical protein Goari_022903 [Gossypium aridum]|uniref:Uncharacterized protein n=1 Tax=Gossypium aridum TaxID=34290 RepID=A0A7J8YPB1_GOSAI|nr:hypothetical protein [Gossypium aridum]
MMRSIALLFERWIWCLLWKSTRPCFSAQRFKLTRYILQLNMIVSASLRKA